MMGAGREEALRSRGAVIDRPFRVRPANGCGANRSNSERIKVPSSSNLDGLGAEWQLRTFPSAAHMGEPLAARPATVAPGLRIEDVGNCADLAFRAGTRPPVGENSGRESAVKLVSAARDSTL